MPFPLDPLSYGAAPIPPGPMPGPRDVSGDMVGGDQVDPAGGCGCHDKSPIRRGKVLLGLALVGAAAYAYRYR